MAQRRTTILDIAKELGISKSAVANVLSGTGRYSAETSELVHTTATRLGYVANRAARSMRASRYGAVGLFLPPTVRDVAFYMDFAFGVADGVDASGADVTLFAREPRAARTFQVDGAIVVDAPQDEPIVAELLAAEIPVVTVGRFEGPGRERISAVLSARHDQLQRVVLDALLARGRRRPALIAVDDSLSSSWAVDTHPRYASWCAEHGLLPTVHELDVGAEPTELARILTDIVDRDRADAIICGGQGYAASTQLVLADRGLEVGRDIDVASFAGARETEIGNPRIIAIDLVPHAYGAAAADLLMEVLDAPVSETVVRWFEGAHVVSAPPGTRDGQLEDS